MLGETRTYSFERITQAIRLIAAGSRFIATNPDNVGPTPEGPLPATGSVAALVSRATGVDPYYVGKPNPLMMRSALNAIEAHSETTAMIGDRMDTDVVAGLEAGLETILVLTGVTQEGETERYSYRPSRIVDSVADLLPELDGRRWLSSTGKVALVTGASGGIGAAVARSLHEAGASVGLLSRRGEDLRPRARARDRLRRQRPRRRRAAPPSRSWSASAASTSRWPTRAWAPTDRSSSSTPTTSRR